MSDSLPRLIALSGPIGAGKTAVANLLWEHYGYRRVSFATSLKDLTSSVFDIPIDDLYNPETKEKHRELLIRFGQLGRMVDEDFWVNQCLADNAYYITANHRLVLDDLRFPNEALALKRYGFTCIRLQPTYERSLSYLTNVRGYSLERAYELMSDPSESSFASQHELFDAIVQADGTPRDILDYLVRFYEAAA